MGQWMYGLVSFRRFTDVIKACHQTIVEVEHAEPPARVLDDE
jgi:hypothetical protein